MGCKRVSLRLGLPPGFAPDFQRKNTKKENGGRIHEFSGVDREARFLRDETRRS